ncbi:MAG: tripartite tricarboxylate transporter substrate binding protein, partial [Xanthobacteraceae bacterium]
MMQGKLALGRCVIAFLTLIALGSLVQAQGAFPTRTVRFIVPFPPGGINDVLARIVGDKLQ